MQKRFYPRFVLSFLWINLTHSNHFVTFMALHIATTQVQSSKVHGSRLKSGILPKVLIPRRMRSSSDSCYRLILHGSPDLHTVALGKAGRTLCRHGSRAHICQHKVANPEL